MNAQSRALANPASGALLSFGLVTLAAARGILGNLSRWGLGNAGGLWQILAGAVLAPWPVWPLPLAAGFTLVPWQQSVWPLAPWQQPVALILPLT
jgi:hypothetical protein